MPTTTIINSIKALSPAEQFFVIEQVLRYMRENENQQAGFTEIGTDYVPNKEVAVISEINNDYIPLEDFRKLVYEDTEKFCAKYGII